MGEFALVLENASLTDTRKAHYSGSNLFLVACFGTAQLANRAGFGATPLS